MSEQHDDDLAPSKTEGFKVGEKKTVEEYQKLGVSCPVDSHLQRLQAGGSSHYRTGGRWADHDHADQNDESLNRWKASLGIGAGDASANPSDPRVCVIQSLALEVEGRPDITIDLTAPGALEGLKNKPFTIKEGSRYQMKAVFKVQNQVLSGLKYLQVLKRKGIRVGKDEEMIVRASKASKILLLNNHKGSYAPNTSDKPTYEKKCTDPFT